MIEVVQIFALLALVAMLAGYVPVRLLAMSWPRTSRLALQPLLGAGVTALTMGWLHYFLPLGGKIALIGLVPALVGALVLLADVFARRVHPPAKSDFVWFLLSLGAIALALAPFYVLGTATSFGLYSNDAFWWTAADWRVQQYAFDVPDEQVISPLAKVAVKLKRYGFNYLSVLVQSVTGLRSWQVVHVNGAFGLFLLVQAGWLFARRLRAWWPMALLIALAAAANHFTYRLFLDAVLAFQYGFAYFLAVMAVVAGGIPSSDIKRRAVLLGLLAASLGVFYADLIPVTGLAAIAMSVGLMILGRFTRHHLAIAAFALGVFVVAMLPLVLALPAHVQHVAGSKLPGPHYRFSDVLYSWLHLSGAMDIYNYMHSLPHSVVQYAGAAAASVLALRALANYHRSHRLLLIVGPVLVAFFVLWRYLVWNGQEYTAHRVMVVSAPFFISLLLASIRPLKRRAQPSIVQQPKAAARAKHAKQRKSSKPLEKSKRPLNVVHWATLLIVAVAFTANLYPAHRMLNYLKTNYIAVTPIEREIGDEWIPKLLPAGAKVTIDLEEDLFLFYGHYMYAEALHGLRGDESRIVFPRTFYMFVGGSPVEQFNPLATEFVLRRKGIGRILGSFRTIASNERYELLAPVDKSSLALVWFQSGFYQMERQGGNEWRWMSDDANMTAVTARPQTLELVSTMEANPGIGNTILDIKANGAEVERALLPPAREFRLKIPLKAGTNAILFDSSTPPALFGGDLRPISIRLINPKLAIAPPHT